MCRFIGTYKRTGLLEHGRVMLVIKYHLENVALWIHHGLTWLFSFVRVEFLLLVQGLYDGARNRLLRLVEVRVWELVLKYWLEWQVGIEWFVILFQLWQALFLDHVTSTYVVFECPGGFRWRLSVNTSCQEWGRSYSACFDNLTPRGWL